ncbi:beta-galactosidase [Octopus bimaculoides]|uniref:beta-galactosidase n=1 Tax=Octopus bimaculoides TaxID=37653 RepID=UPI0022E55121|nr:beta-galactosidase [Octopus bimaculoides]
MTAIILTSLLLSLSVVPVLSQSSNRSFRIDYERNTFVKDGKPFKYVSGSMHYFRTPNYYWHDRLSKMKAAGLNAVQTYIAWNFHEPLPKVYQFSGDHDLVGFLKTAQDVGLLVILRIGPYIDAEWDFGGFPSWMLSSTSNMTLRTMDPVYLKYVDEWLDKLLPLLKPMLYLNGGPVIMVQVENEYGSYFACDHEYIRHLEGKVNQAFENKAFLFTTDGNSVGLMKCGALQGMYATCDFGVTKNFTRSFAAQRVIEPRGPFVNSEFYTGWLDHWGEKHHTVDADKFADSLDLLLRYGANVNMYMFEGGTNFGFWNGANNPPYQAVPTSYDYDAPLTEAGDLTPKYFKIKNVISKYFPVEKAVPPSTPKANYGKLFLQKGASILNLLSYLMPKGPILTEYTVAMEDVKLYYGFTLYRHQLESSVYQKPLIGLDVRDRAYVSVNQEFMGILEWQWTYVMNITGKAGDFLNILVENQAHITFGNTINNNLKGILKNLTLNNQTLSKWEMYPFYDMQSPNKTVVESFLKKATEKSNATSLKIPTFYHGLINLPNDKSQVNDTYIDLKYWTKGQVYINGFNLGRYWTARGPQIRLFVPKTVLVPGVNNVVLFELESAPCGEGNPCIVTFVDTPLINSATISSRVVSQQRTLH